MMWFVLVSVVLSALHGHTVAETETGAGQSDTSTRPLLESSGLRAATPSREDQRVECDHLLMILMHPGVTDAMIKRTVLFARQLAAKCHGLALAVLFNDPTISTPDTTVTVRQNTRKSKNSRCVQSHKYAPSTYNASRLAELWHHLRSDDLLGTTVAVREVTTTSVLARFPKLAEAEK